MKINVFEIHELIQCNLNKSLKLGCDYQFKKMPIIGNDRLIVFHILRVWLMYGNMDCNRFLLLMRDAREMEQSVIESLRYTTFNHGVHVSSTMCRLIGKSLCGILQSIDFIFFFNKATGSTSQQTTA